MDVVVVFFLDDDGDWVGFGGSTEEEGGSAVVSSKEEEVGGITSFSPVCERDKTADVSSFPLVVLSRGVLFFFSTFWGIVCLFQRI